MSVLDFVYSSVCDVGIVISALLGLFGTVIVRRLMRHRGFKLPPGPPGYPLIGNMLDLNGAPKHEVFAEMSKKYGPVLSVYMGSQLFVILNNIDAVTEAFVKRKGDFAGRMGNVASDLATDGGKTIAFNDGPVWALQRKMSMKALRPLVSGTVLEENIHQSATKVFDLLKREKAPVDPELYVTMIVTNILCGVCFGNSYDLDDDEFGEFLHSVKILGDSGDGDIFVEEIFPLLKFCPTPKLRRFVKELTDFHRLIRRKVDEHKKNFSPDTIQDFTDALLLAKEEVEQENSTDSILNHDLTNDHIMYAISDTFGAGVDTTKNTLNFALKYVAAFPEVQRKVQEEVDRVVGRSRLPKLSDKKSLPYTEAVASEVLRLRPAGPSALPHRTVCNTSVGDYDIPKDTGVLLNIWALHHDLRHWDNPDKFIPERFLSDDGQLVPKPKSWLPFGVGKRQCIGKSLAETEMVLLLAGFLQTFDVQLPNGEQPDMRYKMGVLVMRPMASKLVFIER